MKTVLAEPLAISQDLLDHYAAPLREGGHSFIAYKDKPQSVEDWMERTEGADQLILANSPLPVEVIQHFPSLKYINIAFTGVDHVPVQAALDRGILLTNASGYSTEGVAELAMGMALSLLRKIKLADQAVRQGGRSADYKGEEIKGKTLGIIGTGHIGSRLAEIFQALGASLLGYSRTERKELVDRGMVYCSLDDLLRKSDIVSIHLPQNKETFHFIGQRELALMKPSAILINCARGPVVDSFALAEALKAGRISGAGLDVFDQEPPLRKDDPLLSAPNTILTPHTGYFTTEAMEKRATIVFDNACRFLRGEELRFQIR